MAPRVSFKCRAPRRLDATGPFRGGQLSGVCGDRQKRLRRRPQWLIHNCMKKPEPCGSMVPASILGGSNEPPQTGQERRIRCRVYTLFRITQISGSPLMAVSDVAACFSALSVPSSLTHLAGATPLLTFGRRFRLTIFPFGKRARHFIALFGKQRAELTVEGTSTHNIYRSV